jgi:hypothetical protein
LDRLYCVHHLPDVRMVFPLIAASDKSLFERANAIAEERQL